MSSSATPSPTPQPDDTEKPPDFSLGEQVKDKPEYNIPKTLKRPEADPDYSKLAEEDVKKYRSYEEEQQHQIQRSHELEDKYYEQSKTYLQSVIDSTAKLDSAPPNIPVDPNLQKQIQSYQQQNQNTGGVPGIFGMLMLGIGLAFSAAGWRRGWGARNGIMAGWGNAFKAMAQNDKELSQQQADNAYRISELTRQENAERHQQLMEIYQNRRLTLEEKRNLFNETSKLYGMDATHLKAQNADTNQQLKILQNQIKVDRDLAKLQIAAHHKINDLLFNDPIGKRYRAWMMAITADPNGPTKGRVVDPGKDNDSLREATAIKSYNDWLDWDRGKSKADAQGKLPEMPKPNTPGAPTLEDKMKGWLQTFK